MNKINFKDVKWDDISIFILDKNRPLQKQLWWILVPMGHAKVNG